MATATSLMNITDFAPFVEGLDHPEGVTWGPDGFIYAGGEAGQIYRISLAGEVTQIGSTEGFILGLAVDGDLNVYACDLAKGAVMKITPGGQVSQYTDNPEPIPAPNYPVFDAHGNLYFSSSGAWKQHNSKVYCAAPGGKTRVVSEGFPAFANGVALSPDGASLYVVLSNKPGVDRARILEDGSLGAAEHVVTLEGTVPDGVAFDVEGNLYICCYTPDRIYRLTPGGVLDMLAEDPESVTFSSPTNICFAGEDRRTLVVASLARWHLTKGQMPIAGAPYHYPKLG
ncbi:MAG: SMP-30/gluconolactonase/LRE family protein [Anaerolineae bacterium]|nr:SMP-30/gluconolactonase/LRE family protein [Anaerolineae bacterium]